MWDSRKPSTRHIRILSVQQHRLDGLNAGLSGQRVCTLSGKILFDTLIISGDGVLCLAEEEIARIMTLTSSEVQLWVPSHPIAPCIVSLAPHPHLGQHRSVAELQVLYFEFSASGCTLTHGQRSSFSCRQKQGLRQAPHFSLYAERILCMHAKERATRLWDIRVLRSAVIRWECHLGFWILLSLSVYSLITCFHKW